MVNQQVERAEMPIFWRKVLLAITFGKAAVAGAGLGLAALGALDVASAVSAREWLDAVQHAYAFDAFAVGGGIIGVIAKIVLR